jgi:hypothetical protein
VLLDGQRTGTEMLWTIFALLLLFWLLGWAYNFGGALIHLLLIAALASLLFNLSSTKRPSRLI